ncbi:relaxase domain-containing protein [Streptomyces millisiae]|uniref:relaxase domain-containing protein n=1 Tax=Streptomyces millisiae TaxID=3075542 RepID=UPI00374E0616
MGRRAVAGLDFTFSVPKSVSAIWAVACSPSKTAAGARSPRSAPRSSTTVGPAGSTCWFCCSSARARLPGGHHAPGHHAPGQGKGGGTGATAGVIELTLAEVRRFLAACLPRPTHLRGHRGRCHAMNWSNWRRRRQAVARRCHCQRRWHTVEGRPP